MKKQLVPAILVLVICATGFLAFRVYQLERQVLQLTNQHIPLLLTREVAMQQDNLGSSPDGRGTFRLLEPYSPRILRSQR
jgi:hypothetical protein